MTARMARKMCGRGGDQPAVRKGPWTLEEDLILASYISQHGDGSWDKLARAAGLSRNGKSCRLRWLNYLRPGVRRGSITLEEDAVIRELHARLGNRWSKIARHLPGRTDNEVKNYWRTRIQRRPTISAQKQQQSNCAAATTTTATAASSEAASSSPSPASHGQGSSSDAGDWCMQMQAMQPSRDQQAYCCYYGQNVMVTNGAARPPNTSASQATSSPAGDCGWYMHPHPDQESYCSQNAMPATTAVSFDSKGASSSSLASQEDSFITAAAGDGYMQQTSYTLTWARSSNMSERSARTR